MRDALPRTWAQDASAQDEPPRVPFLVLSTPAAYAWPEQVLLPRAPRALEPLPLEAYAPMPSSPSEPCPSAEDSPVSLCRGIRKYCGVCLERLSEPMEHRRAQMLRRKMRHSGRSG